MAWMTLVREAGVAGVLLAAPLLASGGCGDASSGDPDGSALVDTGAAPDVAPAFDAPADAQGGFDATADSAAPDTGAGGTHKTSLSVCWTEPGCHRALVVSHGGDWSALGAPFLSRQAFQQAVDLGADAIEADVRVTSDGVPVIMHSSPIEYYESLDCGGQVIEEMTAAEITQCHLGLSTTETVQRLDDLLDWSEGRVIIELDVKQSTDLAATVATIQASSAADRAFIMVSTGEIQTDIPAVPGWDALHYMVNISAPAEVADMVALAPSHEIFMLEMNRSYDGFDESQVSALITSTLHPAGLKPFTSSDDVGSAASHLDAYHQGFDVVLSYACATGVESAAAINVERGYPP